MKNYEYILFDLDGTLTDPGEGITNSVAYALKKYGIEVRDKRELYKFVGPPLIDSFERFYGFSKEKAKEAVEFYREYYRVKGIFENGVYDGIEEMLKVLKNKGKRLVLATSKPEIFARQIMEHYGLAKYFYYMAGANMDETRTLKADVIKYAFEMGDVKDISRAVMVGDREHDVIGAKANGIDSIGVLFGYGNLEELQNAGATYIAETVEDILNLI